jgi:hypothetical protein
MKRLVVVEERKIRSELSTFYSGLTVFRIETVQSLLRRLLLSA